MCVCVYIKNMCGFVFICKVKQNVSDGEFKGKNQA